MNLVILASMMMQQFCGPNGCQIPSVPAIYPGPAMMPEYPAVPATIPVVPRVYTLKDSDGKGWTHTDWNYLWKWVSDRNSQIKDRKSKEALKSKAGDEKKPKTADSGPLDMNFGIRLEGVKDPNFTGLKTNDPTIASAILPVVINPAGKGMTIDAAMESGKAGYDPKTATVMVAVLAGTAILFASTRL